MSRSYLRLRFDDDRDGSGKLIARAEANGFAGEGGAYFSITEVKAFAAAIAAFPLPVEPRPSIAGGFLKRDGCGELEQEHLGLAVYPISKRGYIGVQVRIASEIWEGDRPESQKAVRFEIITTYEPLSRFSGELIRLIRGTADEALLEGEEST